MNAVAELAREVFAPWSIAPARKESFEAGLVRLRAMDREHYDEIRQRAHLLEVDGAYGRARARQLRGDIAAPVDRVEADRARRWIRITQALRFHAEARELRAASETRAGFSRALACSVRAVRS